MRRRGVDEPERSGAAFRHLFFSRSARSWYLLSNQPQRFVLSVPALICNGPKKVIQYFVKEETRNFREIIKKGHFEIFPGALGHFRIYVYTTAAMVAKMYEHQNKDVTY